MLSLAKRQNHESWQSLGTADGVAPAGLLPGRKHTRLALNRKAEGSSSLSSKLCTFIGPDYRLIDTPLSKEVCGLVHISNNSAEHLWVEHARTNVRDER